MTAQRSRETRRLTAHETVKRRWNYRNVTNHAALLWMLRASRPPCSLLLTSPRERFVKMGRSISRHPTSLTFVVWLPYSYAVVLSGPCHTNTKSRESTGVAASSVHEHSMISDTNTDTQIFVYTRCLVLQTMRR